MADVAGDSTRAVGCTEPFKRSVCEFLCLTGNIFVSVFDLVVEMDQLTSTSTSVLNHQIEKGVRYQSEEVLAQSK